jgi:photosystem II stability/assembly factor-like uncharacterized protein
MAGTILKTTDGGANWVAESSGTGNLLHSVYFLNDLTGFAVGERSAVVRTTDGGTTWDTVTISGTDPLHSVQFPENGLVGYIGVEPRAGGGRILKTINGGDNWALDTVGGPLATSYGCGMATDNQGVVVGLQGMMAGTTDGFGNSTAQGPNTNADLVAAAFSPTDPNRGYLIGNDSFGGVVRFTATFGPVWDTVRYWPTAAFYGVDVPNSDAAYICGDSGIIQRAVADKDFFRTTVPTGFTNVMYGLCFPNGPDTGYAVGAGGAILRTYDGGIPWIDGVAEERVPVVTRAGIRVLSNPCRHGIALHSDADVNVVVFDAAGRVVMRQAAAKGTSFLPLSAGAYFVKAGAQTARAVVTD